LVFAQLRAQDSLDHYLEVQHYKDEKAAQAPTNETKPATASADNNADNGTLLEMVKASMPEGVILTFVQTAPNPKFDVSAQGLMTLGRARVPTKIIEAVQRRMAAPAPASASRTHHARPEH
jgi:hypothetical protein